MAQLVPTILTPLSNQQAAQALQQAYYLAFQHLPSPTSLAILRAHTCLETENWSLLWNFNLGKVPRQAEQDYYQSQSLLELTAYPTIKAGAVGYLQYLLQTVPDVQPYLLSGSPIKFCAVLKQHKYFAEGLVKYTIGVLSLYQEFKDKSL